ncbi:hypothetical protein PVAND_016447 [Polypedilum vanderplanki]|uniref:Uncharacterized protein n=1 Tax=Polypedilum vanderplanki TaxID=319348 RepID=A0A9J6BF59_POLVA|nr:hypothetical protein PVAND_016447 [Polypedilum vanderplanki]
MRRLNPKILLPQFLIILIIFTTLTQTFEINCNYNKDEEWTYLSTLYTCLVTNDSSDMTLSDRSISSITGLHVLNFTNADVQAIYVNSRIMNYFPKNLKKHFKILRAIGFHNTGMKMVKKEDLEPFGEQLESIRISGSDIEIIEEDLFKFNPNLRGIAMHRNKIKFIDGNSMKHLKFLNYLWLEDNDCIDKSANDHDSVKSVINEMRKKCFINFMILSNYEFKMREKRELEQEIEFLRMKLIDQSRKSDGVLREISQVNQKNKKLNESDMKNESLKKKNQNDDEKIYNANNSDTNNNDTRNNGKSQIDDSEFKATLKIHQDQPENSQINSSTEKSSKTFDKKPNHDKTLSDDSKKNLKLHNDEKEIRIETYKNNNSKSEEKNYETKFKTEETKPENKNALNDNKSSSDNLLNDKSIQKSSKTKIENSDKELNHTEDDSEPEKFNNSQEKLKIPSRNSNFHKEDNKSTDKIETEIKTQKSAIKTIYSGDDPENKQKLKSNEEILETVTKSHGKSILSAKNSNDKHSHEKNFIDKNFDNDVNLQSKAVDSSIESLNASHHILLTEPDEKDNKMSSNSHEDSKIHLKKDFLKDDTKTVSSSQKIKISPQKTLSEENKSIEVDSIKNKALNNASGIRDNSKIITSPYSDDSEEISTVTVSTNSDNGQNLSNNQEKVFENENSPIASSKSENIHKKDSMVEHIKSKVQSMMSFFSASNEVDIDKRNENNKSYHKNMDNQKVHEATDEKKHENYHNMNKPSDEEQQSLHESNNNFGSEDKDVKISSSVEIKGRNFDSQEESQTNMPTVRHRRSKVNEKEF